MNLPTLFAKSIHSPEFYSSLSSRRLSFSFRYFFLLASTFAFVTAIFYGIVIFPALYNWIKDFGPAVSTAYPAGLRLEIKDGRATTNAENPTVIEMPAGLGPDRIGDIRNIMVIDVENDFSLRRFDEYNTLVWLMEDTVAFRDKGNSVRIQPLKDIPNVTITRDVVLSAVYQIEGVTRAGLPVLIILGVILLTLGFLIFLSLNLLILLPWALLIMLLASFWQKPMSYAKAYQIGIHASSLSVALAAASLLFPGGRLSFLPTFLTLLIVWINLRPRSAQPVSEK
jgi:hypothetical protein